MKVTKDIDIKNLKEVFKRQIDLAINKGYANVNINFVTALRILYVLEETQIREERHQTLESACTFMEMEDGTQTNEMELHNKTDANGNILRGAKVYEKITKMVANFQKENGVIPKCFGTFSCDRNMDKCFKCKYIKECAKSSDTVPDCFSHYEGSGKCTNCKKKTECLIDKQKRLSEEEAKMIAKNACDAAVLNGTQTSDKVPGCYGNYYDEGLYCNDCKSKESCIEETVNREDVEEDDDFI